ncbi:MAG: phosphatidate cytidylyltransferase [Lentisphaerae bacterium]|nr:phosphatidate cytidylyltransferase [Lentisphaerota bacterium]
MEITYWEEIKRKAVHLSSLWMVAATLLLGRWQWISCVLFGALLVLTLVSEHDYANGGKYLGCLYGKLFGKMLRNEVKPGQWIVSGGAPVLAAALLVNLLFVPFIAAGALAVMLTGDAAAALIGRKYGKHKTVNGKSWEGFFAFIIVGYAALAIVLFIPGLLREFYLWGLAGVVLAAAAELFQKQLKVDDNFSIPLCVGACLYIGFRFF